MNKEKIISLYYLKHLKQVEIAKILKVRKQYVSRIINEDNRNIAEKEKRKFFTKENRKDYEKKYYIKHKKKKERDTVIEAIREQQKQDAIEMSYRSGISDETFAKWNLSAYISNTQGNLILDKTLKVSNDVPKVIHRNRKVPSQRVKKR